MHMTDNEIVRSFLESADKRKQIHILAELNACTEGTVVEILKQDGRVKPNMLHAWNVSQGMRQKREEREAQRKQNEAAMMQEALHKREMNMNSVPPPTEEGDRVQENYHKLLDAYAAMWGMNRETLVRVYEDVKILREMAYRANQGTQGEN